mmetsp:Transcript_44542/g.80041  ORF Transcript_44542/g.80041 Transcript_44542/m.80041 type:complete len:227 (-) Transcript_44542:25-705(-)
MHSKPCTICGDNFCVGEEPFLPQAARCLGYLVCCNRLCHLIFKCSNELLTPIVTKWTSTENSFPWNGLEVTKVDNNVTVLARMSMFTLCAEANSTDIVPRDVERMRQPCRYLHRLRQYCSQGLTKRACIHHSLDRRCPGLQVLVHQFVLFLGCPNVIFALWNSRHERHCTNCNVKVLGSDIEKETALAVTSQFVIVSLKLSATSTCIKTQRGHTSIAQRRPSQQPM